MTKQHILTPQAERALTATQIKAVNHQNGLSSSTPNTNIISLKGSETAGQLAKMSRPQFLSLMCYFGADFSVKDLKELQEYLLINIVMRQEWYKDNHYFSGKSAKEKIDGLTLGAIGYQLISNPKNKLTLQQIAREMGITLSSFHQKTKQGDSWAQRFKDLTSHLQLWLEQAAQIVHKNTR